MEEDNEPVIEFSFPILMKIGSKVKVNKTKVDQGYFECPDYILEAEEGEVMGYSNWTPSARIINVNFTTKVRGGKTRKLSYNLPNSYLEIVK